jgi:DNA-binding NarL/FixJ family response regulator
MIRVLIADDHEVVRHGVRTIIEGDPELTVVGEARTSEEAVQQAERVRPDVVLLDLRMPGGGMQAARRLRAAMDDCKIIALTAFADRTLVMAAVRNQFDGYLLKDTDGAELIRAVKAVASGRKVASASIADELFANVHDLIQSPHNAQLLTPRQIDILERIARGENPIQIAQQLFVSDATVKRDTYLIIKQLQARNRAEAVAKAMRQGLI